VIVVVMGVSGSGKTTVGSALGQATGWPYMDADDFHPAENVAKMRAGTPLTDADRWPWLDRLVAQMRAIEARGGSAILGCSALRQAYRDRLAAAGDVRFVHLKGDRATIAARLSGRSGHYMPPALLDSQIATLEEPTNAIAVDIRLAPDEQVAAILDALNLRAKPRSGDSAEVTQ
jgi:gluconokinase